MMLHANNNSFECSVTLSSNHATNGAVANIDYDNLVGAVIYHGGLTTVFFDLPAGKKVQY